LFHYRCLQFHLTTLQFRFHVYGVTRKRADPSAGHHTVDRLGSVVVCSI
jgi:hypothetical protein